MKPNFRQFFRSRLNHLNYCVLLGVMAAAPLALCQTSEPSFTWNPAYDVRLFPNQENPNRDHYGNLSVWSFMGSPSVAHNPANYFLVNSWTTNYGGVSNAYAWITPEWNFNDNPTVVRTPCCNIDWYPRSAGWIGMHPPEVGLGVLGWRSPFKGFVKFTIDVEDSDQSCGDGVNFFIEKGTTRIASGGFMNGGDQSISNSEPVSVEIGDTLYLLVDPKGDFGCDSTRVKWDIFGYVAPLILQQPVSTSAMAGGSTSFSVGLNAASPPLSFQWRFNGSNLLIGTDPTLSLSSVQVSDAGDYVAVVGNPYGSVTSDVASLTISGTAPPVFRTVAISNGSINLTWSSALGRCYQLQFKTGMDEPSWKNLGQALTATASSAAASDSAADRQRIYRVLLLP
jgi:hypothetical protein